MTPRCHYRVGTLGLAACCLFLATSCSQLRTSASPNHVSATHMPAPAQLAQLDFGRQSTFALCIPPACPERTPKTLAPETPSPPIAPAISPAPIEPIAPDPVVQNPVPKTETSRTVTVQFDFGSARLLAAARSDLSAAIADLPPVHDITITGRTDSTGPLAFNETLALARAIAVRGYLRKTHPALTPALTLQAQGGCCFIVPNDTLAGRARNRRVEVLFRMTEEKPP